MITTAVTLHKEKIICGHDGINTVHSHAELQDGAQFLLTILARSQVVHIHANLAALYVSF